MPTSTFQRTDSAFQRDGEWHNVSYAEVGVVVSEIGRGLLALGVEPRERVCILANTRPEWTYCDFAISAKRMEIAKSRLTLTRFGAILVVIATVARIAATYDVFSETTDEPMHVSSGLQIYEQHRYDVQTVNPPLPRLFIAARYHRSSSTFSIISTGREPGCGSGSGGRFTPLTGLCPSSPSSS